MIGKKPCKRSVTERAGEDRLGKSKERGRMGRERKDGDFDTWIGEAKSERRNSKGQSPLPWQRFVIF